MKNVIAWLLIGLNWASVALWSACLVDGSLTYAGSALAAALVVIQTASAVYIWRHRA